MNADRRNARLTVYKTRAGSYNDLLPNGVEITDMRIRATIEKRLGGTPDACTIIVSNLKEATRVAFQEEDLKVILEAGYDGEYRRLFYGDLRWGASEKTPTGYETTLQVADGARAFREAKARRTFREGTTVRAGVAECALAMGLKLPRELEISPELEEQFANGLTLDGPAHQELSRLLAPYGYDWMIQDGVLYAYRDDQAQTGQALVVSPDNGLLGTPVFAPPTFSAKKSKSARRSTTRSPRLDFRSFLYPQIVPGAKLKLDCLATRAMYKTIQVSHTIDTHGEDWFTAVEAKPV